jgi:hypothetical protein
VEVGEEVRTESEEPEFSKEFASQVDVHKCNGGINTLIN